MIIGERFNGDLLFVQDMQHDFYNRFIGTIFYKAKMKYLAALKVIDIDTQLGKDIKDKESMDHRPIQYMHDVIAALIPDYQPKKRYKVVGEYDAENRVIYYDMSAAEVSEFRAVKE